MENKKEIALHYANPVTFTGRLLDQATGQLAAATSKALNKLADAFKSHESGLNPASDPLAAATSKALNMLADAFKSHERGLNLASDVQHLHMPAPRCGINLFATVAGEELLSRRKELSRLQPMSRSEAVKMIREKLKDYLDGVGYENPITVPDIFLLITGIKGDEAILTQIHFEIRRQGRA